MRSSELKDILIQRIRAINDESFLYALKVLTDTKAINEVYELNEFEEQKIARARGQIKDGEVFTQEEVFKEVDSWLKKA